jgi:hypothetical protein
MEELSNEKEKQYRQVLLEAARLIRVMGANDGVSSVIPDFLEGDRNFDDTLQILKGVTRNWHVKENVLFQVWTLKQNYAVSNEDINGFWPDWYTDAMKAAGVRAEDNEFDPKAGEEGGEPAKE